jgi:hypothetical protein
MTEQARFVQQRRQPERAPLRLRPGLLQRKCACGESPGLDDKCPECRAQAMGVQRRASEPGGPTAVPPIVHAVLRSPGKPLDSGSRGFFEPRFGHDFSNVRVHTDARSAESAQAVKALAYTVGPHIVFGAGQYTPSSGDGRRLLAHELTHVVQQSGSGAAPPDRIGDEHDASEAEAARMAVSFGAVVGQHPSSGRLQRQPKPTAPTPPPSCTPRTGVFDYGCYCGRGKSCPTFSCTPADPLDACCRQHDIDYGDCTFSDRSKRTSSCRPIIRRADAVLCDCARALAGHYHGQSERYRRRLLAIFC